MSAGMALVLSSGGLNSCVLTALARQEYRLAMLHAEFDHRSARCESECFQAQEERFQPAETLTVQLPHLRQIRGNARVDKNLAIEDSQELRSGGCNSFVAGLIPTLLGVAQSWAAAVGASVIMIGVSEDLAGPGPATKELYPDHRAEFFHLYAQTLHYATLARCPLRLETPLLFMTRGEIIRLGQRLGAPLAATWSCLRNEDQPCGTCYGCTSRARGFAAAGIADPQLTLSAGHSR
ncbi:MAG TPA: 7-cyano-7-deazaguanine synthase [Phycisphaerae bacterium]|nr:7-cyano-7-deazaguanine synthase [Phycisphaerae bacterium]